MSAEKANVLRGLGAKIIRTPNEASFDSPDSHIGISRKYHENGQAILLDQYCNPSNPIGKNSFKILIRTESGRISLMKLFLVCVRKLLLSS
jgi:cysteine synthase